MIAKRVSGRRRGPPGLLIAGASGEFGAGYDGSVPFPGSGRPPPTVGERFRAGVTAVIVLVPFAGLAVAVRLAWGQMVSSGFPALCAASLALPFAAGWVIGGTWHAALTALL